MKDAAQKKKATKKRVARVEEKGRAHIKASFNNLIMSMTNLSGQVIAWSSSGKMRFKGKKKATPFAALTTATDCTKIAYDLGLRKVDVYIKGAGSGRESAVKAIQASGIEVLSIRDITPLPHNGCRPPKRRRA